MNVASFPLLHQMKETAAQCLTPPLRKKGWEWAPEGQTQAPEGGQGDQRVDRGTRGWTGGPGGGQGYQRVDRGTRGWTGVPEGRQGDQRVDRGTRGWTGVPESGQGY